MGAGVYIVSVLSGCYLLASVDGASFPDGRGGGKQYADLNIILFCIFRGLNSDLQLMTMAVDPHGRWIAAAKKRPQQALIRRSWWW